MQKQKQTLRNHLPFDDERELFSGDSSRGHVPVNVALHRNVKRTKTITKLWFEKADWENWSLSIDVLTKTVQFNGDVL